MHGVIWRVATRERGSASDRCNAPVPVDVDGWHPIRLCCLFSCCCLSAALVFFVLYCLKHCERHTTREELGVLLVRTPWTPISMHGACAWAHLADRAVHMLGLVLVQMQSAARRVWRWALPVSHRLITHNCGCSSLHKINRMALFIHHFDCLRQEKPVQISGRSLQPFAVNFNLEVRYQSKRFPDLQKSSFGRH